MRVLRYRQQNLANQNNRERFSYRSLVTYRIFGTGLKSGLWEAHLRISPREKAAAGLLLILGLSCTCCHPCQCHGSHAPLSLHMTNSGMTASHGASDQENCGHMSMPWYQENWKMLHRVFSLGKLGFKLWGPVKMQDSMKMTVVHLP